ncbi:MAG: KaiC domain-containing protein [Candidatus Methanoperedens sp.]|nr:KaiC domain-containing protein [Candidatus Methanoperedens sp.]
MERVKTGIEDLDEMLSGGIPQGCVTTIIGGFGTGKSTLALKFVHSGLVKGEKCLYISIEQKEEDLIKSSALFGWDFKPYIEHGTFKIIRLSPTFLKTTIAKIESELPELIKTFAPKRLVVDPITLYEMIFDNEGERREQLFKLIEMIKDSGTTSIIVSESGKESPYVSRFGLIEYIADGVITLRYLRGTEMKSVARVIEISKMRMTEHSDAIKPYEITKDGIVVHIGAEIFGEF